MTSQLPCVLDSGQSAAGSSWLLSRLEDDTNLVLCSGVRTRSFALGRGLSSLCSRTDSP
jgi:hypothetical protein